MLGLTKRYPDPHHFRAWLTKYECFSMFLNHAHPGASRERPMRQDSDQRSIFEKSATARVALRISLSSFRRFSRTFASSSLTRTLSKNASTGGRRLAIAPLAGGE